MAEIQKNKQFLTASVSILGFLVLALAAYLLLFPLYPIIKYEFLKQTNRGEDFKNLATIKEKTKAAVKKETLSNRVIIQKIGVDAPIIESNSETYGLNHGVWHLPESPTPEFGGNTVLTGHRFKYLPPSNLTFYLLDKLEPGDIVSVIWQQKFYYYKVGEKKIVSQNDQSILAKSSDPILTIFTCDPIWSEENRLVVIGELVEQQ